MQKWIRTSTKDEDVNIVSEVSEDSNFPQHRCRLNKKAHQAKAKQINQLSSHTHTKKLMKNQSTPTGQHFRWQVNQPWPTYLQHPVVLQDLWTRVASFTENGPRTASLFQRTVGPILSQRPLPLGKFLIGYSSRQQQEALLQTKVLGGVNVACCIPQTTTEGVIKPVQ